MKKLKVVTVVGTRPEIIRLSAVISEMEKVFDHTLILTGQNYDPNLSSIFLEELGLNGPSVRLEIESNSTSSFVGKLISSIEEHFLRLKPDAVVILGDTNSGLSVITANKLGIPVYHLEAGNRSFDRNVPEEFNRRLIDHASDFNLVYSEHARRNLESEGIKSRSICLIGSPMFEVFKKYQQQIENSVILKDLKLKKSGYILVSMHRQENIDEKQRLATMLTTLQNLSKEFDAKIVVSTHPRTKSKIEAFGIEPDADILFMEPTGFFDYVNLQRNSLFVLSDSGSLPEEASILGFRGVAFRNSMERPEALEAGHVILSGLESEEVIRVAHYVMMKEVHISPISDYSIPDTSKRVTSFILSTIGQHKFWNGIR